MTAEQRFERDLPGILADLYPASAPDYRDDLVRQIAATRQRPAWALPERWIPMGVLALNRSVRPMPWRTIGVVALLLLALVAVAILAGTQRRLPAPFGLAANGQLVLSEAGDIYFVDPATGGRTLAIGGATIDSEPQFSRDGTRIAFFREVEGKRTLLVADERGANIRTLSVAGLGPVEQLSWSPDGASILLMSSVVGKFAPAIVPTDGSAGRILALDKAAENPIWLPSGEILYRATTPTGFGLFAVGADGTGVREVLPATGLDVWDALFFDVSPDGTQIAYQWRDVDDTQKIYVIPAAGGTTRAVTSVESVGAAWSPDGAWIATLGDDGVYVVRADGSGQRRLIATTPGGASIRWTPDGKRLLVVVAGEKAQRLFDPGSGVAEAAPWTSTELPDWQRLALPR